MTSIIDKIFYDYTDKLRRYFWFTPEETKALIITVLVLAFMFSFDDWGAGSKVEAVTGLINFALAIIIVASSLLIHVGAQRAAGLQIGFRVEYKMWVPGLLIGLALIFLTNGKSWWVMAPGGIFIHSLGHHRLGYFRYGLNYWSQAGTTLWGTIATLTFAMILKALWLGWPTEFLANFTLFNTALAIISMLPIPPYDGSRILFQSRLWWMSMSIVSLLIWFILIFTEINLLVVLVMILTVFFLVTYIYHLAFERSKIV